MRSFEFARKIENGVAQESKAFPEAQLPEYQTAHSAGADFFCAEDVTIPSIWKSVFKSVNTISKTLKDKDLCENVNPTLVHTGVRADMEDDEVLEIFTRSSNPKKLGLVLANSVGIIDSDYYSNPDNDGEIMFAFYNFKPWDVTIHAGDRIGQGIFKKFLRPTTGLRVKDETRTGGFGSTGNTDKN